MNKRDIIKELAEECKKHGLVAVPKDEYAQLRRLERETKKHMDAEWKAETHALEQAKAIGELRALRNPKKYGAKES